MSKKSQPKAKVNQGDKNLVNALKRNFSERSEPEQQESSAAEQTNKRQKVDAGASTDQSKHISIQQ